MVDREKHADKQASPGKARRTTAPRTRDPGASIPVPASVSALPSDYTAVLGELKRRISETQLRAARAVNRELTGLYWHIGETIVRRQDAAGWGEGVVDRLAHDLTKAFPDVKGFSPRNMWRMRAFFLAWTGRLETLTQAVSETASGLEVSEPPAAVMDLPWGHNIILLQQVETPEERLWYAQQACEQGWSRAVLAAQIEKRLFGRQGKAVTNFEHSLPSPQSGLAQQTLKDPYTFDFLTVGTEAHERAMENDLLVHIREFLLELGAGFAFVGNQVKLVVDGTDYYLDLLFYHVRLRCYVVVELKATEFLPEHAGKMNFYLSAVDDLLKHPDDQPSIGLLLCRSKRKFRVEYALRDIKKPIGVAEWETKLIGQLPESLKGSLPSVEEIEAELEVREK
jgi:predicted nuclease of restriction endonuclease-like (RecB) superfamily